MGRRRMGREAAFKAAYRVDLLGQGIEDALAGLDAGKDADAEAAQFARELLETIGAHRIRIDEILEVSSRHWSMERMGVVDRSILRLGIGEILYWPWIPNRVSIDEYVEIAKKYGTEESGGFVNAILDRVSRESEKAAGDAS